MADMSADNRTTTANVVNNFKADEWVAKRAKLKLEIKLLTQEIEVLKEDAEFYGVKL